MHLSMPKQTTWWLAVILGVLGIILFIIHTSSLATIGFVLVAVGWLLLALGTYLKGL